MKIKFRKNGFVLLFAVLLTSAILSISLVILNITLKQLVLSSVTRDSQLAYYAAETGYNCALFWYYSSSDYSNNSGFTNKPFGGFSNCSAGICSYTPPSGSQIGCSNTAVTINVSSSGGNDVSTFTVPLANGSQAVVRVTAVRVSGDLNGDGLDDRYKFIVLSNGYSVQDVNNPRRVERSLESLPFN